MEIVQPKFYMIVKDQHAQEHGKFVAYNRRKDQVSLTEHPHLARVFEVKDGPVANRIISTLKRMQLTVEIKNINKLGVKP